MNRLACIRVPGSHEGLTSVLVMNLNALKKKKTTGGFPGGTSGKEGPCQCRKEPSLDQEDPLEEGMTSHCSILPWRIPWTEEPGGLQSIASQKSQIRVKWLSMHK